MVIADHRVRLEHGLVQSAVRQAGWIPRSQVHRLGGLTVVLTGTRDQTQQVALVGGEIRDAEASVVAAEVCFERARWRPAFDLADGAHPDLEAVLDERGYRVATSRPGMVGSTSPRRSAGVPEGVRIAPADRADRDAIVEVQRLSFDLPWATARALVHDAAFADPEVALLVARDERLPGDPVVGSVTVHLDPTAGVVGAGVLPNHRRRGIGSALTRVVLDLAARHGSELAWLQASTDGEALYRSLGFVEVGSFRVWMR